jgi:uncharacterized protein YjbI with pentapeptide repeats
MASIGTAQAELGTRLTGKTFAFGAKAPDEDIAKLIKFCGATVAKELDASVTYVIAIETGKKALEKAVQQLNKKGASISIIETEDLYSMLNLTPGDFQTLLKEHRDLWRTLTRALPPDFVLMDLDLSSTDLTNSWFGIDLSGINFSNSKLTDTEFYSTLKLLTFDRADLSGSSFETAEGCSFVEANLTNVNFSSETITKCDFRKANLSGVSLSYGTFTDCDFSQTNLDGADLSGTEFNNCNFAGASLAKACLDGADLSGANLRGAILAGSVLTSANLSKSNLTNADLREALLCEAKLSGATIDGADFTGALVNYLSLKGIPTEKAKGLSNQKQSPLKAGQALLNLQAAADKLKKFDICVRTYAGPHRIDLRVLKSSVQTDWEAIACINSDSVHQKTAKSLSQAMVALVGEWSSAVQIDIDSFEASNSKTKADIAGMARAA